LSVTADGTAAALLEVVDVEPPHATPNTRASPLNHDNEVATNRLMFPSPRPKNNPGRE